MTSSTKAQRRLRAASRLRTVALAQQDYQEARDRQSEMRRNLKSAVLEARKDHTLQEIGEVLGTSRQGVYDLLNR